MNEETMKILKMLEEGKIDAEKARDLMDAVQANRVMETAVTPSDNMNKMLKIRVNSQKGDNVNINIPVKVVKVLGTAIKRIPSVQGVEGLEDIDIQAILQAVSEGLDGKIVDVKTEEGDIVEVVVE